RGSTLSGIEFSRKDFQIGRPFGKVPPMGLPGLLNNHPSHINAPAGNPPATQDAPIISFEDKVHFEHSLSLRSRRSTTVWAEARSGSLVSHQTNAPTEDPSPIISKVLNSIVDLKPIRHLAQFHSLHRAFLTL